MKGEAGELWIKREGVFLFLVAGICLFEGEMREVLER